MDSGLKKKFKNLIFRQNVTQAAILITILATITRIIGFLREMMIAAFFGAKKFTDSFIVAQAIPGVLAGLISGALSAVFIPLYAEWREKKGKEEAERFTSILLTDILIILIGTTLLAYFLAPFIVNILAPGFNQETRNLTLSFTYIMLPSIIFWGTYGLITGLYNSQKSFFIPNLAGLLGSVIFIISIFLFHKIFGAYILPWGYLANVFVQYILLIPALKRIGVNLRWEFNLKYEGLKKALILIGPIFLGQSVGILNMAVDRIFGSYLSEGSISALNYASRIYQLPMNLFVNALATAIYTDLAFSAQNDNLEKFKLSIEKIIRALLFFIIPATFGLIFLSTPIVQLAFQRGAFDAIATQRTSESLTFYSIGLVFMSINLIMVRGFYALHDTKTPTINSILALLSNIALNTIFIKPLAHRGLALATSLASFISFVLLYRSFRLKIGEVLSKETKRDIIKFMISGALIGMLAFFIYKFLDCVLPSKQIYLAFNLFSAIGIVVMLYLYLGKRWKIDEARKIWSLIDKGLKLVSGILGIK